MNKGQTSTSVEREFIERVWGRIKGDLGGIMAVRRCLVRRQPNLQRQAAPYIYPYLPAGVGEDQCKLERYLFVAALMAFNSEQPPEEAEPGTSFGKACYALKQRLGGNAGIVDATFQALLSARYEEVYLHVERLAYLLREHDIPCDWAQLLEDLNFWDYEGGGINVALRWARDYYQV